MSNLPKPMSSATRLPAALVRRTAGAAAFVLALGGAFAAGHALAGRDAPGSPPIRLTAQGLGTGRSCADLRQWYVDHAVDQVTAWGWRGPQVYSAVPNAGGGPESGAQDGSARAAARSGPLGTTTGSSTGTNVQVAAVDEPDVAKASGSLLVRVVDDVLTVYDVSGAHPREVGTAPLLGMTGTTLLMAGDRVVAIGADVVPPAVAPDGAPSSEGLSGGVGTRVRTFDLSDPSRPSEIDNRTYDAALVAARESGDVVRLVLSTPPPALRFVVPQEGRSDAAALKANQAVVRASTIEDWLPTVTVEGGTPRALVGCADVAVPTSFDGLGTLAVVGFDPASQVSDVTAVATASDVAMMSTGHLYVAAEPWSTYVWPGGVAAPEASISGPGTGRTTIYAFDLTGTGTSYAGAGGVDGRVSSSWSMDEWEGVLRVAVQTSYGAGSTSVVLLRPEGGALVRVAALDGLGAGQQLKSVRWLDDLAVLVTFQQVDPFYAIDLGDPTHPRVLGVLHLPGWSSYLHPVGPHLVLGLGQGVPGLVDPPAVRVPTPGTPTVTPEPQPVDPRILGPRGMSRAKATLFDLSDPARPRTSGTVSYPGDSTALAGLEPHQVSWLPDRHVLLTVIGDGYDGTGGWLSVLTVGQHSLADRLVRLAPTSDLRGVRTVPLADGRVVLVDGDEVRFVRV